MRPLVLACVASLMWSTSSRATDPAPQGLWLHAALDGGVVGGDPVVGVEAGIGFDTTPFSVHLDVPVSLRVYDFPPRVDPALPGACVYVRCEEWLDGGKLSAETLSRVVDSARIGQPGDWFHLKAGRLFATLGHGQLVDEYTNASDWDRRHSGVYAESNLPFANTHVEVLAGDIIAPQNLVAARVTTSPMAPSRDQAADAGTLDRFLGRFQLGFEFAGDFDAPIDPVDANGDIIPGSRTRPVLGAAVDATWPLLDEGWLQIAPFAAGSMDFGLRPVQPGFGGALGLQIDVDAVFVALRANGSFVADGPGHRTGLFGTFYDVDRRCLPIPIELGPTLRTPGAELIDEPNIGFDVGAELVVMRFVHAGARWHAVGAPQLQYGELFASVDVASFRADARIVHRAQPDPAEVPTYWVAEIAWQVFPPFSVFARWQRLPRFHGGFPVPDDDVVVGASFDLVLSPG